MSEQLRFIVTETNKLLSKDFNLISFDALSPEQLLQVVVDVLAELGALATFEVLDADPEATSVRILDALRGLKYRPQTAHGGASGLRRGVVKGDRKVLQPVLLWLLRNPNEVKKRIYLAKYLIKVDLPLEVRSTPEIATLWEQYESLLEVFKETHKEHEEALKHGMMTRELQADLEVMMKERDTVQKRIDRMSSRLEALPGKDLALTSAESLRRQMDRSRELTDQQRELRAAQQRAVVQAERLRKALDETRTANRNISKHDIFTKLRDEIKVNEFMVHEKLPKQLEDRKKENEILKKIINEPIVNREYIMNLQSTLDKIMNEVQTLVEAQVLAQGGPGEVERLGPFRQQAAAVRRAKDEAADKLQEVTAELRAMDLELAEKQNKVQELLGDNILRGEDLKMYVNRLRAKSSVYKKKRAQLSCLKAESGVLMRTIEILKSLDPSVEDAIQEHRAGSATTSKPTTTESRIPGADEVQIGEENKPEEVTMKDIVRLRRDVAAAKARLAPLTQELRPEREELSTIEEDYEEKKKIFDSTAASLEAEKNEMETEITEMEAEIEADETKWQRLQQKAQHSTELLETARAELRRNQEGGTQTVHMINTLEEEIVQKEAELLILRKEVDKLDSEVAFATEQREQWSRLAAILEVKTRCHKDLSSGVGAGTLRITHNAETLTLNN